MIQNNLKKIITPVLLFLIPVFSEATTNPNTNPNTISFPNTAGASSVQELLAKFLAWIVNVGTVAVVLAFIYTGFQFVAARGNPDAIKKAKTSFLWTVIGTLILLGAHVLVAVVKNTLTQSGVDVN